MQPKLTRREKEVFDLLLDGKIPKEIAAELKISYDTVTSHQKKLYRKLCVHSIEELLEKYQVKNEVVLAPENKEPKFIFKNFIPALIAIIIFIGIIFYFSQRRGDAENLSESSRIYLTDGTYFTGKTFDDIYLYANKWENIEGVFYGEQYFSYEQIWLSDIYSGSFNELMGNSHFIRLKISGEVDKECKNMMAMIHYVYQGSWYYEYQGRWHTAFAHSGGRQISIGPGEFSEIFILKRETFLTLPEGGYFIVCIFNTLLTVSNGWVDDIGERIPEDMPNGTRWATIKNLKIEPLDRLAK